MLDLFEIHTDDIGVWGLVSIIFSVGFRLLFLLITFASSMDPDQVQQNVGPDLDTLMVHSKSILGNKMYQKATI